MNVRELLIKATTKPKRRQKEIAKEQDEQIEDSAEGPSEGIDGTAPVDQNQAKFEIGCSRQGGDTLWHEGFRFMLNKKKRDAVHWRCELSRKNGCPVTAITGLNDYNTGRIVPSAGAEEHTHLPKPCGVKVERRLANFNKRARTEPNIPPSDLVSDALNVPDDDNEQFALMPTAEALAQRAAKRRRPFGQALNGNEVANIVVPPEFCLKDGRSFVVYDSSSLNPGSEDRIILFASYKALSFLRETRNWSADSTFSVCPRVFKQKLVIGAYIQHRMYPAAYALMTRKTQQHYIDVFQHLKLALGSGFCPESVLTDFEAAEIAGIKSVFPAARIQACLFHYGQSLFRRLKEEGLAKHCYSEATIRTAFRRCISLAFLPPSVVRRGMALIVEQSPNGMEGFLFYVAKNYIGLSEWECEMKANAFRGNSDTERMFAGIAGHSTPRASTSVGSANEVRSLILSSYSRHSIEHSAGQSFLSNDSSMRVNNVVPRYTQPIVRDPLFQIPFWNVRNRVKDDLPRSQASMEATHLAFQKNCKRRPRMFDFLTALHKWDTKKMQEVREASNKKLPRRRPEFIEMDRQLLHFVNSASLDTDLQIIVFLDAISMALQRLEPNFQADAGDKEPEEMVEENANQNMPPIMEETGNENMSPFYYIDHDYLT